MRLLTVFTCTYNRESLLKRCYDALCRQTSNDFIWLIIDDGSTDATEASVAAWKQEETICIKYVKKENGGLHTGYNKAIELMDTEICVCIDSDDYMPDDAVEYINYYWKKHRTEKIAGFVGLDQVLGKPGCSALFPEDGILHYLDLKQYKKYNYDNKVVMRVDLLKKVAPQPTFHNEKNFNPMYLILKIDQLYPFRLVNKILCYVDYQQGGMTDSIINQYFNSPNSFLELRKLYLSLNYATLEWKIRHNIHLIADALIAKKNPLRHAPNQIACVALFPMGCALFLWLNYRHSFS